MSVILSDRKKQMCFQCKTVDKLYKDDRIIMVIFFGTPEKKYKGISISNNQIIFFIFILKFSTFRTYVTDNFMIEMSINKKNHVFL